MTTAVVRTHESCPAYTTEVPKREIYEQNAFFDRSWCVLESEPAARLLARIAMLDVDARRSIHAQSSLVWHNLVWYGYDRASQECRDAVALLQENGWILVKEVSRDGDKVTIVARLRAGT